MPMRLWKSLADMSAVPFDDVASQRAEQVGFATVRGKVPHRLVRQRARLRAGGVGAHQRNERRLARAIVLAQRLAGGRLVSFDVEQVVSDLEGEADVARVVAQVRA